MPELGWDPFQGNAYNTHPTMLTESEIAQTVGILHFSCSATAQKTGNIPGMQFLLFFSVRILLRPQAINMASTVLIFFVSQMKSIYVAKLAGGFLLAILLSPRKRLLSCRTPHQHQTKQYNLLGWHFR